jgi:threonine dehydratase/serine racemase
MAAGRLILQTAPATIADGLLTSMGDLTWPIIRDNVERVVTVTEEDIVTHMRLTWERAKLLIEASCATAVAVALSDAIGSARKVGVILTGGNVDLDKLPWMS